MRKRELKAGLIAICNSSQNAIDCRKKLAALCEISNACNLETKVNDIPERLPGSELIYMIAGLDKILDRKFVNKTNFVAQACQADDYKLVIRAFAIDLYEYRYSKKLWDVIDNFLEIIGDPSVKLSGCGIAAIV